jgi:hypothetical protein
MSTPTPTPSPSPESSQQDSGASTTGLTTEVVRFQHRVPDADVRAVQFDDLAAGLPNAYESRPSPQPRSMTMSGMPSVRLTFSKNVDPVSYSA